MIPSSVAHRCQTEVEVKIRLKLLIMMSGKLKDFFGVVARMNGMKMKR